MANLVFINSDISNVEADVIVNASNGIGFMGGYLGKKKKYSGIAESLHYTTNGDIEKYVKKYKRVKPNLPLLIYPYRPGDVFVTPAFNLKAEYIIHAVTMTYPGTKSDIVAVSKLLPEIVNIAKSYNAKTIALPLLGAGVGGIPKQLVKDMYINYFKNNKVDLTIYVISKED